MNLVISGKNLDITEGLRSAIEDRQTRKILYRYDRSTCYVEHGEKPSEDRDYDSDERKHHSCGRS